MLFDAMINKTSRVEAKGEGENHRSYLGCDQVLSVVFTKVNKTTLLILMTILIQASFQSPDKIFFHGLAGCHV